MNKNLALNAIIWCIAAGMCGTVTDITDPEETKVKFKDETDTVIDSTDPETWREPTVEELNAYNGETVAVEAHAGEENLEN